MEKDNISIDYLDVHNNNEIILYEKALYKAFSRTYVKSLSKIWIINHQQKTIKTIVEYDEQEICIAKRNENILAAMAINYNMSNSQLSLMNFNIDFQMCRCCEVLHVFSLLDYQGGNSILENLSIKTFESLRNKNIETVYGTCSDRRINAYEIMGFKKINDLLFFGEKKYLLEYDVTQNLQN